MRKCGCGLDPVALESGMDYKVACSHCYIATNMEWTVEGAEKAWNDGRAYPVGCNLMTEGDKRCA